MGSAVFLLGSFAGSAGIQPTFASITVQNGDTLDIGGSVISTDSLILIDGKVVNGELNASESFDVRSGEISAKLFGFGGLVKTTGGVVVLSSENGYSGGSEIRAGVLRLEHSSALGLGPLTVNGGSIDLAPGISVSNDVVLDGAGFDVNVDVGSSVWSGIISELTTPRGLTKTGAGTLTLTAANTYTGPTTVSAGILRLDSAGTLGASGGDVTIESGAILDLTTTTQTVGVLTLTDNASVMGEVFGFFPLGTLLADTIDVTTAAGTSALIETNRFSANTINKNGAGALRLDAPGNFGFSGVVELNEGVLDLGWQGVLANGTVNAYANTRINYFRGGQNHFNQIVLKAGTVQLTTEPGVNIVQHGTISDDGNAFGLEIVTDTAFVLTANNTYTGVTTLNGGGTLYLGLGGTSGSVAGDIALTNGSLGIYRTDTALDVTGVISGAGGISTQGLYDYVTNTINAGKWTLSGDNTYSGGTNVDAGTLRAGSSTAFGTGFLHVNNNPLNAPGSIATISLNGFDISASGLTGNGVFDLGGKTLTVSGTGGFLNGASFTAGNLTISSGATQSFAGVDLSLIVSLVADGTLSIDGSGNVAPQSLSLGADGRLDLEFMSQAEYVAGGISGGGQIFLDDGRLTLGTGNIDVSLSSFISGSGGSLKKTGTGVLTLSSNNTFDGGIDLEQGTLRLTRSGAAGSGPITTSGSVISYSNGINSINVSAPIVLASNTTKLDVQSGEIHTQSGVISETGGARPLEKTGGGYLILAAANTYTGLTTVTGGRLQLGDGGSIAGDVFVGPSGNAWFDFGASTGTLTYSGVISGGQAAQIGTGTTVLTGVNSNSYWGISDGTLRIGSGGKLAADTATFGISGLSGLATLDLGGSAQTVSFFRLFDGYQNAITNGDLTVTSQMLAEAGTISANLLGSATLIKNTGGTTILSGTNTYNGTTTVNGGTLILQNGAAIADSGSVEVASGATLQVDSDETIGQLSGKGNVSLGLSALSFGGDNQNSAFGGTVSGSSDSRLIKEGSGKFTVEGDLGHSGSTIINGGEINFNGTAAGSVVVSAGGKLSGSSTISGNLTVDAGGTLATGNSPGTTTVLGNFIGGGTLDVEVQFDNAGSPVNGTTHDFLTIAGNVTGAPTAINLLPFTPSGLPAATTGNGIEIVRVGGAATAADFTMTSYLLGDYYYDLAFVSATFKSFYLQSSLAVPGCSVDNFDNACFIDAAANILGAPVNALGGNDTLQLNGATDFTFDVGRIGTTYTNFEVFQKADANTVTLSGVAGSASLGFDVQNGTLVAGSGQLGNLGAVNVFTPGELQVASNLQIGSLAGTGTVSLTGGKLDVGYNNASTTFAGVIQGANEFAKNGSGTLTLTGANTYTGTTVISGGTLAVQNGSAISDLSQVLMFAGTFRIDDAETVERLFGDGNVVLNDTLTINSTISTGLWFFDGLISGSGGLTLDGTAGLILRDDHTHSGLTTVKGGASSLLLGWNSAGGMVGGDIQLEDGSSVRFSNTASRTWSNSVSGDGAVIVDCAGFTCANPVLTVTGVNNFTGQMIVENKTLQLTSGATFGQGIWSAGSNATIDLGGTTQTISTLYAYGGSDVRNGTLTGWTLAELYDGGISANLAGTGRVEKYDAVTFTLSGNNTYSGSTLIDNGTLIAQGGRAIGDASAVTVLAGGTLELANAETIGSLSGAGSVVLGANTLALGGNNGSVAMSGVISGVGGKLIKQGTGVLTLSGANTFTGGIDVIHGTLALGSNQAAGTGPITTFGTVISYANAVNNAAPIVIASNTTQVEQIGGSAQQSGSISETGGARPLEKIGNGNLTLSGINTFTGPMTISDGTLTLQGGAALADVVAVNVAAPGTLALNTSETVGSLAGAGTLSMTAGTILTAGGNNASTIFSGTVTGGGFTKTGTGSFTFAGSGALTGPWTVNAGTFTKTGGNLSGATAFSVASGATAFLGASAAGVNGAGIAATSMGAITNGGTLYLDNNTSVSGTSLALSTGSNLNLFLTTNTSIYPQIALSGAASVAGNLGVYLDPLSFGSTTATSFTYNNVILGGSRTGTFGSVNLLQSPSGLFSVAAAYGANDVDLTVTRSAFTLLGGGGGNAPNVGGAVEDIFIIGTTDPDLVNLINTVATSSPSSIAAIYAALSGSTSAETSGGGLRTDDPWKQTVAERINAARAPGCTVAGETWCLRRYAQAPSPVVNDVQGNPNAFDWLDTGIRESGTTSAWLRSVGSWTKLDSSDYAPGSRQWTGGVIGGLDHVFDTLFLAGIAGQYLETSVDFEENRNSSHIRSAQLGAYMSFGGAEAYVNANTSVIGTQARSERYQTVGLLSYEIDSFMRGLALTAAAEAGTIMEIHGYRFEPSMAFNYQYGTTEDYAERGGGGLSLLVRPDDSQSLRSTLTARLSRVYDLGDRKIVPQIRVDWRHEHLDRGQSFQAAFAGAPNVVFDVEGTAYARDQLAVGAGVTVPLAGRLTGYADALGTFSEDATSASVLVGVRATW